MFGITKTFHHLYNSNINKHTHMKKSILLVIALIVSVSTFGQTAAMNVYYGTSNKLGMEFYAGPNKVIYGFGISTTLSPLGIGEDYNGILSPDQFDEIIEVVSGDDMSYYGILGYQVMEKLTVSTNFGYGTTTKFYNSYDRYKILSPTGYYHTSSADGGTFIIGLNANYNVNGKLSMMIGFDNFNQGKIGVGLSF